MAVKRSLRDRVYNGLLKVFGPAQISPMEPRQRPVDHSPAAAGDWVLRRGRDGRPYLTAGRGESPAAPSTADGD